LVKRLVYGNKVAPFIGNHNAKVFMGIRRCGKSTLMQMTANEIVSKDPDVNVIEVNLELWSNRHLLDADALYHHIKDRIAPGKDNRLFVDEIQDVKEWESVIRSLIAERCCDIYLTGSNSSLLYSEYSTYLSGRLNTISVQPLTLRECMDFRESSEGVRPEASDTLNEYLILGGFPDVWLRPISEDSAYSMLRDIYAHIILKDIVQRHGVKNTEVLGKITGFLCDNIGNNTSPHNIYTKLIAEKERVDIETVYQYIGYLEEAYFVTKVKRFDLKGKKHLESDYKYYIADIGLKHSLLGFRREDVSKHIENTVYNEMVARGYEVCIGKAGKKEIDFVGERSGKKIYIQATYVLASDETIEREFGNLKGIQDGFPKYVVGKDPEWKTGDQVDGIVYRDLAEFLTSDDW